MSTSKFYSSRVGFLPHERFLDSGQYPRISHFGCIHFSMNGRLATAVSFILFTSRDVDIPAEQKSVIFLDIIIILLSFDLSYCLLNFIRKALSFQLVSAKNYMTGALLNQPFCFCQNRSQLFMHQEVIDTDILADPCFPFKHVAEKLFR